MSDHELASEAHKTTFAGMMSNSRVLSLFCGFVLLLLAALFGVPVPLLALTAIVLVVAFVFMGGSAATGVIALVLFAIFGLVWKFGSWFIGLF
jgi:hypothetical protein